MPSTFSGMNPYLKQSEAWQDFHQSFVPLVLAILSGQVRLKYLVKMEERVFVPEVAEDARRILGRSDVSLAHSVQESSFAATKTLIAPAYSRLPSPSLT